ncbi:MAG: CAAX protease, partial [Chloroflexota bacterium]
MPLDVLEFLNISLIVTVLLVWLFVSLLLAPLEALGWWAGWFEGDEDYIAPEPEPANKPREREDVEGYLVFLTGISGVSGEVFLEEEVDLLQRLEVRLNDVVLIDDVYPYGVTNRALTGQRVFAWFWRFAQRMKVSGGTLRTLVGFLINIRNGFQVSVSADRRYGPIYNTGTAQLITRSLLRAGYKRGTEMP